MASLTVRGIVVRYAKYREADRILTLITHERGKLTAAARGARRTKSKLMGGTELFCYGVFDLFEQKDRFTVDDCQLEDNFYDLRLSVDKLAYGTWVAQLAETCMNEGEPNEPLFLLTLQALAQLCYGEANPRDAALAYALQLLDVMGYRPPLTHCARCGREVGEPRFFDVDAGGVSCGCLRGPLVRPIHPGLAEVMRILLDTPMDRFHTVHYPPERMQELRGVLADTLSLRLERPFTSLSVVEQRWGLG